ncbi:MAG: polysaccharide deacetylase family protein [Bacteroidetes bacterium]|nr:polysaccharide deacetylase family protein [Bacteroidota bacterium]
MLNFKSTSILFIIAMSLIGLLYYFFVISLWWFVLPIVVYKSFIIYGSATIQSDFFLKAYCSSNTTEKKIAITFDDGPHRTFTPQILSVLAEQNVPATFFVIGKNIQGNESIIKQINETGNVIGNHTFSHSFFIDLKTIPAFTYELDITSDAVYNITGKRIKLFRPPYGVTTPNIAKAVKELNYYTIGWNIRSMDTTRDSTEVISKRVKNQVKPGAIILFHDTSEKTVEVLKQTLNFAKENGFKIVSIEELLGISVYQKNVIARNEAIS